MNISKEEFTKLAKEHLIALESYNIDNNGYKPIEIYGFDKLYKALTSTVAINATVAEVAFCNCDAPIIRTGEKNTEYCGICCKNIK